MSDLAAESGQSSTQTSVSGASGGQSQATSTPSPAAPSSTLTQGTQAALAAASQSPQAAQGQTTQESPAQAQWSGIRDAAKQYGYDLGAHQTDGDALQYLIAQARSANQAAEMARWGQYHLQHQEQFQQYLQWARQQESQQKQQTAQEQANSWWKAPEFDPRWRQQVQRDPATGRLVPAEGAPPDIVQKYLSAAQHQQDFLDKFAFDPVGSIKPGVEQVAREIAMQVVRQHLGGFSDQQHAQSYIERNSSWIHEHDAQGQLVYGQNGQPQLSVAGKLFGGYVQQAVQMGIGSEEQRAAYARSMVERQLAILAIRQEQTRQAQLQQGEAAKTQFVQQGAAPGAAQRVANSGGSTQAAVQNKGLPLYDRLRQRARAAGITDETLAAANGR